MATTQEEALKKLNVSISNIYWRSIKSGKRTFESIPNEEVKELVRGLAKSDVENGVITKDDYEALIGEPYEA